ncbi:hypothetical protein EXIGLDRAFT_585213, partial [Exidia glandulosa HHB12029]
YPNLNDQNYAEWSMRTEAVLVRRGLWGVVHIWLSLRRVHQARGFATTLALKRTFLTSKKAPGQSMQSWIRQVSAHVFRMEQAGITVGELDRILAITIGLPPSYTPVIIHFDSLPASELTLNGVITRLLNEETRQQADTTPA